MVIFIVPYHPHIATYWAIMQSALGDILEGRPLIGSFFVLFLIICLLRYIQVKSSHLYLYSAFNNTNCNKALDNIKIGKLCQLSVVVHFVLSVACLLKMQDNHLAVHYNSPV